MPPAAPLLAALLHAATALALFWMSPLYRHDLADDPVEVTFEEPKPPEPPPVQEAVQQPTPLPPPPAPAPAPAPPPPPPPAAAAKPTQPPAATAKPQPQPQAKSNEPLGISPPPPDAKKPDEPKPQPAQEAKLEPQKPAEPKPQPQPEAKAEPAKPVETPPQPPQEAAATLSPEAPPTPEPPPEKIVPPVETPPAPLTMRDFVNVMPPPPAPHPAPPSPQQQPAAPQHTLQHSPLSPAPTAPPQSSSGAVVSTFVNPAEAGGQTRAKDAYLWQVIRKFSQYLPDLRDKNEGGTVILRFVIARDGRLVEASIAKSSGVVALDRGLLDSLRAASPYPPLPPEIPGAQAVFVQPIAAKR